MIRVWFAVVIVCSLGGSVSLAQEPTRFDLHTSYSYIHTGDDLDLHGAEVSGVGRLTHSLSIEGVVDGHFGSSIRSGRFLDPTTFPAVFPLQLPFRTTDMRANVDQYHYLAGPRYTFRASRVQPYVHALFGVAHRRVAGDATVEQDLTDGPPPLPQFPPIFTFTDVWSDTSFAMAFGGGADVRMTERLWIRVGKVDYVQTRFERGYPQYGPVRQNNIKLSAGLTFRF